MVYYLLVFQTGQVKMDGGSNWYKRSHVFKLILGKILVKSYFLMKKNAENSEFLRIHFY